MIQYRFGVNGIGASWDGGYRAMARRTLNAIGTQMAPLALCSGLAAVLMTLCWSIDGMGYFDFGCITAVRCAALWVCLLAAFFGAWWLIRRWNRTHALEAAGAFSRKRMLLAALVMLVCWLPYIIALYPALFLGDTMISIGWFDAALHGAPGVMYDHNPVFTTVLFGAIEEFGKHVMNNDGLAFFLYVLVQAVASCLSLALVVEYLFSKLRMPKPFCIVVLAFCALCPLFPTWSTFVSKDTLFIPAFMVYFVMFVEAVRSRGALFARSWAVPVVFVMACLVACLSKKLGFYIMAISNLVLFIWLWRIRSGETATTALRRFGVCMCIPLLVMMVLLPKILFPAFGIVGGERYEALSVPIQQTARCYIDHGDQMTEEQVSVIDNLLDTSDLKERYQFWFSDPVKYRIDDANADYAAWANVYAECGIAYPGNYLESYLALEQGFGSPSALFPWPMPFESSTSAYDSVGMQGAYEHTGFSADSFRAVDQWCAALSQAPGVTVLFRTPLYCVIVPFFFLAFLFCSSRQTRARMWIIAIPVLLTVAGVWMSPISTLVHGGRYALPVLYMAPLLVGLAWWGVRTQDAGSSDPSSS